MSYEIKLTLKYGNLYSHNFSESDKSQNLLKEYLHIWNINDSKFHKNTERQKEILCLLIDLCSEDAIYIYYECDYFSKEKAKEYVLNYDKNKDDEERIFFDACDDYENNIVSKGY